MATWRTASHADAYGRWADATADEKAARFVVFTAAIDREEAAARSYDDALAKGKRAQRSS